MLVKTGRLGKLSSERFLRGESQMASMIEFRDPRTLVNRKSVNHGVNMHFVVCC